MRRGAIRLGTALALSAGVAAHLLRPDAASAASGGGALIVTSFVQSGRTDVRRNEILEFRFTTTLKKSSVGTGTFFVDEIRPDKNRPTIGARVLHGNVVLFDPQRTQANYDNSRKANSLVVEKDHPVGFPAYQDFVVNLPVTPPASALKSSKGGRLVQPLRATFRTNDRYDDPIPGQPSFIGDHGTGLLGVVPPRDPTSLLVDENASIVLEFSEPILPETLDPSSTVLVTRVPAGDPVVGFVQIDPKEPSGRRFLFVPSIGFGSDLVDHRGWDVRVALTTGITDLAGNALKRPVVFSPFRTAYAPAKPPCSVVLETFADRTKMDTQTIALGGEWNTLEKGALLGGFPTTYPDRDVRYAAPIAGVPVVRSTVAEPFVATGGGACAPSPNGSRVQMLYTAADVGPAAAIVGVGWGPSSNALNAARYPEATLALGHTTATSLGHDFASNVNIGGKLTVYQGPYDVSASGNVHPPGVDDGYADCPTFTSPFEWNGVNNLVVDVACRAGNGCQLLRVGIPGGAAAASRRAAATSVGATSADLSLGPAVCDIRFKTRRRTTQAVSLWYDDGADHVTFAAPVVAPVAQPGGTGVVIEIETAAGKPDPFVQNGQIPDLSTATGFAPASNGLVGRRFFRFRISMTANLATNKTVRLTSVQFPYCD